MGGEAWPGPGAAGSPYKEEGKASHNKCKHTKAEPNAQYARYCLHENPHPRQRRNNTGAHNTVKHSVGHISASGPWWSMRIGNMCCASGLSVNCYLLVAAGGRHLSNRICSFPRYGYPIVLSLLIIPTPPHLPPPLEHIRPYEFSKVAARTITWHPKPFALGCGCRLKYVVPRLVAMAYGHGQ